MARAATVGSLVSTAMGLASEMDPEETEYLACPTIADDSLAHQDGCQPRRTQKCDGLRQTPGKFLDSFCEVAAADNLLPPVVIVSCFTSLPLLLGSLPEPARELIPDYIYIFLTLLLTT